MEVYSVYGVIAGLALCGFALLWLIVAAFGTSRLWGLGATLLMPIFGPIFLLARPDRARKPVALLLMGGVVIGAAYAANFLDSHYFAGTTRDKAVEGDRHVTLTGATDRDYAAIPTRPDTVVLQMANDDVTDATLDYVAGLTKLRELDLSYSQVTDAGLAKLKGLPLVKLWLVGTKVTDEGFREHILPLDNLMFVDISQTAVKSSTGRDWKNAKPDRKFLQ